MPPEDSKTVEKEEIYDEEDDDEKSLGFLRIKNKKQPNNIPNSRSPAANFKASVAKMLKKEDGDGDSKKVPVVKKSVSKVKKEETDNADKENGVKGAEQNGKKKEKDNKKGTKVAEQDGKKKEKKVYTLPGQKRDPPEERDPLRIFYESLYEQVPESEMAAIWMMEHGLLPNDVAKKVYEKKLKKAQQQKLKSPMKSTVTVKTTTESSVTVTKKTISKTVSSTQKKKTPDSKVASKPTKKRKANDDSSESDSDDDFIASRKAKKQKA